MKLPKYFYFRVHVNKLQIEIEDASDCDVVEVVRCKDCVHRPTVEDPEKRGFNVHFPDDMCPCQCDDGWYNWYPKDDWFCAYGERKERAND